MTTIVRDLLISAAASGLFTVLLLLDRTKVVPIRTGWLGFLSRLPFPLAVWIRGTILIFLLFSAANAVIFVWPYAYKFLGHLMGTLGLGGIQLGVGPIVIVIGYVAYLFKTKNQVLYGWVEVTVAGISGIVAARQIVPGAAMAPIVAALVASVYVVSRGSGNIAEGHANRRMAA